MGLENAKGSSPAGIRPTAARALPKLVPNKSLSECCEGLKWGISCQELSGLSREELEVAQERRQHRRRDIMVRITGWGST